MCISMGEGCIKLHAGSLIISHMLFIYLEIVATCVDVLCMHVMVQK